MNIVVEFRCPTRLPLVLALMFFIATCAQAQEGAEPFAITADALRNAPDRTLDLNRAGWRYRAGDDLRWAAADLNDRAWERLPRTRIDPAELPRDGWDGRAWFRLRVRVDDELARQPLALRVWQRGASEIYIDGARVQVFGRITPDGDEEYNPRGQFVPVVFEPGTHTIAVRYSYLAARDLTRGVGGWLARANRPPFVSLAVAPVSEAARELYEGERADRLDYALIGVLFALALVHMLLYLFYPDARGNLFYSFFAAGFAATGCLARAQFAGHYGGVATTLISVAQNMTQAVAVMSLLAFLYVEFAGGVSRLYWLLCALWLGVAASLVAQFTLGSFFSLTLVMLIVTLATCLNIIVRALARQRAGARIIAAGVCALVVGVANNVAAERNLTDLPTWLDQSLLYTTILSVPLAVSIYLARNFARTNRSLSARLVEVEELSSRQLEQERQAAELRVEHERTSAENERRAKELEEARRLQLSMLPKKLPDLPHLEVAAYMKPATEVGGDYYDFHTSPDGTLTVIVGDATGHGLKAGTVVTATKSLFNDHADDEDIASFFASASRVLKRMNLRGLFMAAAMLKTDGRAARLCVAGMPPVLHYRAATGEVEELLLRAAPLGGISDFPYREHRLHLASGDCLVLMSDGFPERFDARGEMLGYDKAREVLRDAARMSAQEIVERFVETGDSWADGQAQTDDVTFVVLRVKG